MSDIHSFGTELAQAISAHGGPRMEYLADDGTLVLETANGKQIVRLHNFYLMHRSGRSVADIAELILQFGKEQGKAINFESVRPLLHLHIVSEDYVDEHGLFRPMAPGLKLALVADYPDYVRFIVKGDLERIGQSEDVLWQIAEVNTDAKMPTPMAEPLSSGKDALVFDCSMGSVYAWRYAITHGIALVGSPRRDLGVVVLDDQQDSAGIVAIFTRTVYAETEDHPLSPLVYLLCDGKIAGLGGAIALPEDGPRQTQHE